MKTDHKLTLVEKAQALNDLAKHFNHYDSLVWMLAQSGEVFHKLNSITRPIMNKYGIDFSEKDFDFSEKGDDFLWKLSEKCGKDFQGNAKACWILARFFLQLADTMDMIEKAAK